MLKKVLSIVLFTAFFVPTMFAQTGSVEGTVTDAETGDTIPGANVLLMEINKGAATDAEGNYEISDVEVGSYILRVTFVGYETYSQPITITANETLTHNVQLESGAIGLKDVIVTGYGQESRIEYTGSAVSVNVDEQLENVPVVNIGDAMQGAVTGVNVRMNSGTPGSEVEFNIRGIGSINAGGDPLVVVDGTPISIGSNQYGLSTDQGFLSSLNPNSIQDITVLKGPVATSQYGAEGANGVVLITTKEGIPGQTQFSASYQRGTTNRAVEGPEMASASDHITLYKEALVNAGSYSDPSSVPTGFWDGETNSDWSELITNENAVTQSFNFSASGGNEQSSYYGAFGYQDAESVVKGSGYERFSGNFNFDYSFNENIDISNKFNGSFSTLNGIREGNSYFANPITSTVFLPQTAPAFNDDGSYYTGSLLLMYNPLYIIENDISQTRDYHLINGTELNIQILDNFSFTSKLGIDYSVLEEKTYSNPVHSWGADLGGFARAAYGRTFNGSFQNGFNYIWDISDDHSLDARLVGTAKMFKFNRIVAAGQGFAAEGLTNLASASTPVNAYSFVEDGGLLSVLTKVHYSFRDKVFLDGTIRREGNSRFAEEYRWGTFYGIGAGWLLSSEDFLRDVEFLDLLKVRASFGLSGNNQIDRNQYQAFLGFDAAYANQGGIVPAQLGNELLTWEKKRSMEAGLEFGFLNRRINGSVVAFRNTTYDLLYDVPLSLTTGFNEQITNVGELQGKGIEAALNLTVINTADFLVSLNSNFTYVTNEVTKLPTDATGETLTLETSTRYQAVEGYPVNTWYMKTWAGVDPDNGMPLWELNDGSGGLTSNWNEAQRESQGASGLPTHYGSIGLRLDYKGAYVGANLFGSFGNKVYDTWASYYMSDGVSMLPLFATTASQLDRWQEPGDITDVPERIAGGNLGTSTNAPSNSTSSRYLHDGDFLRLQTVRLGYNVPPSLLNELNIGLRGLNVFVVGRNLWTHTFDEDLEWDPQVSNDGFLDLFNQTQKALTFGVNVKF